MKLAILTSILVLGLVPRLAAAGDSSWLLCKGVATVGGGKQYVAASILEHRGDDGASRDLDVTLLKGANVARGTVVGKKLGGDVLGKAVPLALVGDARKQMWTGTLAVTERMDTATLDGTFDQAWGAVAKPLTVKFHAKLACEVLDDLAIGH